MKISDRQKDLLGKIVEEYINGAWPVSSQLLEKKYEFGVCPATIRNEMQVLARAGYLIQPHTSAGRIPTDKAYRFFVNQILSQDFDELALQNFASQNLEGLAKEIENTFRLVQALTKDLASFCSDLALSYILDENIAWKQGWEKVFEKPEFRKKELIMDFADFMKHFEENISTLDLNSTIKIYIGNENPFPKSENFSIIISRCDFPKGEKGILSILGPKRMDYNKNINLLNVCKELLEAL